MARLTLLRAMSSMSQRTLALGAVGVSLICSNACGGSAFAEHQTRDARLEGSVSVCSGIPEKCSSAEAVVSVLDVRGKTLGKTVAKEYARHGHFSFLLVPGKYFPSATFAHARLSGVHCIAGEILIHSHESVDANISCYTKLTRSIHHD